MLTVNKSTVMDFAYQTNKLTHFLNKSADMLLQEHMDMNFSEFLILMAAKYTPDTSQADIAEFMNVTSASISRHVKKMSKEKLISIVENKKNRRKNTIELTKHGEAIFKKAYGLLESHLSETLVHISAEKYDEIMGEMRYITDQLEDFVCKDKQSQDT